MIGMLGEELFDLVPVSINLALEGAQHPGTCERHSASGASDRVTGNELAGTRNDFHAPLIGLSPGQLVAVKELLPFALTRGLERMRCGEAFHKGPGTRQGPVIEGFHGRWIVFMQSTLELVDESSPLLNQGDLIAAE